MSRPVIYFGSSFNPITHAHMDMIKHMLREAIKQNPRPVIWLAPVYTHILCTKPDMADYQDRLEMTRLAAIEIMNELKAEGFKIESQDLVVSDIDKTTFDAVGVNGTLPVLQQMQANAKTYDIDPNNISMVLGNDTYEDILGGVWNKAEDILGICKQIHVFDRDNQPVLPPKDAVVKAEKVCQEQMATQPENKLDFIKTRVSRLPAVKAKVDQLDPNYFIIHHNKVHEEYRTTSSTKIRGNLEEAEKGVAGVVYEYIVKHPWIYRGKE